MIPLLGLIAVLATRSYDVRVDLPRATLVAERPETVSVTLRARHPMRSLRLYALPGIDVDANPIGIALHRTGRGRLEGRLALPVRGPWYLAIEAADPPASTSVPLTVTAPGAIPPSFAWAIACFPLLLFAIFLACERERMRKSSQDEPFARPKTAAV